jgi:hypothetical protein
LLNKCNAEGPLVAFFALLSARGDDGGLAADALDRLLRLDGEIVEVRRRVDLYIGALGIVLGSQLAFEGRQVAGIFERLMAVVAECERLFAFPLAPPAVVLRWIEAIGTEWDTDNFKRFRKDVAAVRSRLGALVKSPRLPAVAGE